jgi:predicted transcriptional regulator
VKKLKNEAELLKEALRIGAVYAEKRKVGKIDTTDSLKRKVEFIYRLLVHDKLIQPLAKDQENEPNMKHKLALWVARQLPAEHPLLK